ncbi:MAG: hypothetical protein QNJ65_08560, partial [Xenococcaceae cyanobacterium MO_234.B1]|nr:hypothetical protein [Xenococcaceae cyanobacterium MO_234.B1]
MPEKAIDPDYKKLLCALKACSAIKNNRTQLIELLDNSIADKVDNISSVNEAAISIILAFRGFPQKIDELLETVKVIEGESKFYKDLHQVIFEIASRQQENLKDKIKDSFAKDFNEVLNIHKYIPYSEFNDLWRDLCSILKDIDWRYIWKAFQKVIDFRENADWRNEIYLKSFCFTKNYEWLKRILFEQYEQNLLINLGKQLNKLLDTSNQALISWLEKLKQLEQQEEHLNSIQEIEECDSIPILLVIADRNEDDSWTVQAQLKHQGIQEKIEVDEEGIIGIKCNDFQQIPLTIEAYIDYLNNEPKFKNIPTTNLPIEKLRIEVFIPIINLALNFDCWAEASEESFDNYLVQSNRLFLRSRERCKGKNSRTYRRMLPKGWKKLEQFLKNESQSIT